MNALESYLDMTYPGFLDIWGGAVARLNQTAVREKLADLGRRNGMSFPARPDLNQILFDVPAESVSLGKAIVAGSAEAATDITTGIAKAASFGLPVLVVMAGVYFAWQAGLFKNFKLHPGGK
jgi:hypothetical protein